MGTVQRAVVDGIVDDVHVVLLVGPDEVEHIVHRSLLPAEASEGTWLQVRFEGDRLVFAIVDEEATVEAVRRISSKMDMLRQRGGRLRRVDAASRRTPDGPGDGAGGASDGAANSENGGPAD